MHDPSNKEPAHGVRFVDGQPTVVFDTICTKEKSRWLAVEEVHELLIDVWKQSTFWLVGALRDHARSYPPICLGNR